MSSRMTVLACLAILLLVFAGCGAGAPGPAANPPPLPTRTPRPTFTPTVPEPTATLLVPTETPVVTSTVVPSTPTALPPTAVVTPTAQPQAILTATDLTNVRSGPSTDYDKIGQLTQGQQAVITGKSPAGDWWQFSFNGQTAWVSAAMVTVNDAATSVAVAQTIPPSPVPQPVVQPPTAEPTQPPAPAPTAAPSYAFAAQGAKAPWGPNPNNNDYVTVRGWIGCNLTSQTCVPATLKVTSPNGLTEQVTCYGGLQVWYVGNTTIDVYNTGKPDCKVSFPHFVAGTYTAMLVDGSGNQQSDAETFDAETTFREWLAVFKPN